MTVRPLPFVLALAGAVAAVGLLGAAVGEILAALEVMPITGVLDAGEELVALLVGLGDQGNGFAI